MSMITSSGGKKHFCLDRLCRDWINCVESRVEYASAQLS